MSTISHQIYILLLIAFVFFVGGCLLRVTARGWNPSSATSTIVTSPPTAATHPAAWRLPDDQRNRIVAAVLQANLGDRKEDVLAALGKPDGDRLVKPKGIGLKPHGSLVTYHVVKYENGLVNEKWDENLMLEFDMENRLRFLDSNLPEVPTKGEMIRRSRD